MSYYVGTAECPRCEGEGVVPDPLMDGFLDMPCPACEGEGWLEVSIEDDDTPH
jgi:DnaJ-class molecular chaperone